MLSTLCGPREATSGQRGQDQCQPQGGKVSDKHAMRLFTQKGVLQQLQPQEWLKSQLLSEYESRQLGICQSHDWRAVDTRVACNSDARMPAKLLQGYLAHEKPTPRGTLQ